MKLTASDLARLDMVKTAVVKYTVARLQEYHEGKIHALDCIIPINHMFEGLNIIERMVFDNQAKELEKQSNIFADHIQQNI